MQIFFTELLSTPEEKGVLGPEDGPSGKCLLYTHEELNFGPPAPMLKKEEKKRGWVWQHMPRTDVNLWLPSHGHTWTHTHAHTEEKTGV